LHLVDLEFTSNPTKYDQSALWNQARKAILDGTLKDLIRNSDISRTLKVMKKNKPRLSDDMEPTSIDLVNLAASQLIPNFPLLNSSLTSGLPASMPALSSSLPLSLPITLQAQLALQNQLLAAQSQLVTQQLSRANQNNILNSNNINNNNNSNSTNNSNNNGSSNNSINNVINNNAMPAGATSPSSTSLLFPSNLHLPPPWESRSK